MVLKLVRNMKKSFAKLYKRRSLTQKTVIIVAI